MCCALHHVPTERHNGLGTIQGAGLYPSKTNIHSAVLYLYSKSFAGTPATSLAIHFHGERNGGDLQAFHHGVDLSVQVLELTDILLRPFDLPGVSAVLHPDLELTHDLSHEGGLAAVARDDSFAETSLPRGQVRAESDTTADVRLTDVSELAVGHAGDLVAAPGAVGR